uniref:Uncharacterized protein n=1 Tax=Steinernema glaseri TaxID=37863 RepID=A0A1I8AGD4_9BILA
MDALSPELCTSAISVRSAKILCLKSDKPYIYYTSGRPPDLDTRVMSTNGNKEKKVAVTPSSRGKRVSWSPKVSVRMIESARHSMTPPGVTSPARRCQIKRLLGVAESDSEDDDKAILGMCGWNEDAVLVGDAQSENEDSPKPPSPRYSIRKMARLNSQFCISSSFKDGALSISTANNHVQSKRLPTKLTVRDSFLTEFGREVTLNEHPKSQSHATEENKENSHLMELAFNGDLMDFETSAQSTEWMREKEKTPEQVRDFWDDVTY